jgi:hypothetical protein
MKRGKILFKALQSIIAVACVTLTLGFSEARADAFDDIEAVSENALEDMRGGFVSANGLTFGFGATIRTYADGQLAMATQLVWTGQGPVVTNMTGAGLSGVDQTAPIGAGAVIINDGQSAIIHRIQDGQFQNVILNAASDRAFRQEVDVQLTLPGFEATQQQFLLDRLGMRLNDEVGPALLRIGGG